MTLSQPIEDRTDTPRSRWLMAGKAATCNTALVTQSPAPRMLAFIPSPAAIPLPPHQSFAANRPSLPGRADLFHPHAAAKSP